MKQEIGKHVKILLINSTIVEGIVEEWNDESIILKSIGEKSYVIIKRPQSDIMLIKVMLETTAEKNNFEPEQNLSDYKSELNSEFDSTYNQPSGDPLRDKRLAELKILINEADKEIISNKLKSHHIGNTKKVKYEYPGFLTK
ncbi:hypothetical protein UFOVP1290_41 [uncultured Caudovirales phage]|uniref:Uncharacterized protein n=1 Tax=uncultured Caudovirales phage TaxID=2100421 RepID=A0A6J5RSI4_9CAUD|nr:hypothetical protein UFOVP1290_41 [uncultured Caudovirales phage]